MKRKAWIRLSLLVTGLALALVVVLVPLPGFGAQYSASQKRAQESHWMGALAGANPAKQIVYVDSGAGNNGNSGADPQHAVATLARALAIAQAGDTIVLNPGGSETLTAGLSLTAAQINIVCPVVNPDSGYTLSGAGTLDLLTVSAADCRLAGLKFVHTGATANAAGVLTTAAADRLTVQNCVFDDSAISATWTGAGVEITDDCNDVQITSCRFKDLHRGVLFATATGKNQIDSRIRDCVFWVGQATAFGIHAAPAGTGTVVGMEVQNCLFRELDGDGTSATDSWDGSDGTNANSGPISFGAAVDQYTIADCGAYTASAETFTNLQAINVGAAGALVNNDTGSGDVTTIASNVSDILADTGTTGVLVAADAITASVLAANAITASEVADGAIDAGAIADGAIDAATFAAGAVDASAIASNAITSAKLATDSIGADEIANDAIDAGAIANSAIDAATFAAGAIDATAIAADALTAAKLATNTIGADEVADDAIDAGAIANAAIDAATFADDTSLAPGSASGTTDIDISESDYTSWVTLLTITPGASETIYDLCIDFDWNKATTGFDTIATGSDTLDVIALTKVDGTNWRGIASVTQVTATGAGTIDASVSGARLQLGSVAVGGSILIQCKVNAERGDVEIPYRATWRGPAPTITEVSAGA